MFGNPLHCTKVEETISVTPLTPVGRKKEAKDKYSESHLQQIIDQHPTVLAIDDFLSAAKLAISLGREIPVDLGAGKTGYIDNLLVTDTGHLVVVETKLWNNPQALREVVAQVLHYGMALMALSVPAIEKAIRKSDAKSVNRLAFEESISDRIRNKLEPHDNLPAFDDRLDGNIRSGEMLFLIVGDEVHLSVERFTSWLRDFKALPFQLGLIELRFFTAPSVGTMAVPRTLLRTTEVARHVVKVEMSEETSSRVKIAIEDTIEQDGGGLSTSTTTLRSTTTTTMDESRLIAATAERAGTRAGRFVSDLVRLLGSAGFDSKETPTELAFGIRQRGSAEFVPLLHLQVGSMYAAQGKRLFELVGEADILEHRRALNRLAKLYSQEATEDIIRERWKGCLMPRYDAMTCSVEELGSEFMRFRDLVLMRMQRDSSDPRQVR